MTTWLSSAACLGYDPAIWFPGQGGDVLYPKSICATCPVVRECREQSLAVREPYGVWGGLSEDERASVLAARTGSRRTG